PAVGAGTGNRLDGPPGKLAHGHGKADGHDAHAGCLINGANEQAKGLAYPHGNHQDASSRQSHRHDGGLAQGLKHGVPSYYSGLNYLAKCQRGAITCFCEERWSGQCCNPLLSSSSSSSSSSCGRRRRWWWWLRVAGSAGSRTRLFIVAFEGSSNCV